MHILSYHQQINADNALHKQFINFNIAWWPNTPVIHIHRQSHGDAYQDKDDDVKNGLPQDPNCLPWGLKICHLQQVPQGLDDLGKLPA